MVIVINRQHGVLVHCVYVENENRSGMRVFSCDDEKINLDSKQRYNLTRVARQYYSSRLAEKLYYQ